MVSRWRNEVRVKASVRAEGCRGLNDAFFFILFLTAEPCSSCGEGYRPGDLVGCWFVLS